MRMSDDLCRDHMTYSAPTTVAAASRGLMASQHHEDTDISTSVLIRHLAESMMCLEDTTRQHLEAIRRNMNVITVARSMHLQQAKSVSASGQSSKAPMNISKKEKVIIFGSMPVIVFLSAQLDLKWYPYQSLFGQRTEISLISTFNNFYTMA